MKAGVKDVAKIEKTSIGSKDAARNGAISRESVKSEQRATRRRNRGGGEIADWSSVAPTAVVRAIAAVTREGGAIRLGYTRDKGAYAIGIIGDGEPYSEYVRPSEDVELYLNSLAEDFEDGSGQSTHDTGLAGQGDTTPF